MPEQEYRIWSIEHEAWWTQDSTNYAGLRAEAGVFSLEEALAICLEANEFSGKRNPLNALVPVSDKEE